MTDAEGIEFLRWCLPRLHLAWHGFRLRRIRRRAYFEETLQREVLQRMTERLLPSGAVIFGLTEALPEGVRGLEPWSTRLRVYRRGEGTVAPGEAASPHHPANGERPSVDFSTS